MFRVCDGNTVIDTYFNYMEACQWADLGLYSIEIWNDVDEVWDAASEYGLFQRKPV